MCTVPICIVETWKTCFICVLEQYFSILEYLCPANFGVYPPLTLAGYLTLELFIRWWRKIPKCAGTKNPRTRVYCSSRLYRDPFFFLSPTVTIRNNELRVIVPTVALGTVKMPLPSFVCSLWVCCCCFYEPHRQSWADFLIVHCHCTGISGGCCAGLSVTGTAVLSQFCFGFFSCLAPWWHCWVWISPQTQNIQLAMLLWSETYCWLNLRWQLAQIVHEKMVTCRSSIFIWVNIRR